MGPSAASMGRGTIILLGWEPGTVDSLLLFSPVVERRSIEMGCNRHGPGQCYFVKRKTGPSGLAPSTPKTPVSLLFWLQREEGALVSDPALLPPAAGPASGVPSPLLASLPLPTRPLQPPLDFKHLLAFHFNGAAPLTLFPNFSTVRAGLAGGGMQPRLGRGLGRGVQRGGTAPRVTRCSPNGATRGLVSPPPINNCWAPRACCVLQFHSGFCAGTADDLCMCVCT